MSKEKNKMPKRRAPHTRIDNRVFSFMDKIGTNGFAVYAVLKKHENRHTGRCWPSYQTVADITGLDRKTVIKYTMLLVKFRLINKQPHFIDGRQSSNRYSFPDLPSGRIPPSQDGVEASPPPSGGVPPEPLPSEPALTKKQEGCPHKEIATPMGGVAYCRNCWLDLPEGYLMTNQTKNPETIETMSTS